MENWFCVYEVTLQILTLEENLLRLLPEASRVKPKLSPDTVREEVVTGATQDTNVRECSLPTSQASVTAPS